MYNFFKRQNSVFIIHVLPTTPGSLATFMPSAMGMTKISEKMMAASTGKRFTG